MGVSLLCPNPGHLAGARGVSGSCLQPPFSASELCIIETLTDNSYANGRTVRADVKHLVLFLLACKEIIGLKGEKKRVGDEGVGRESLQQ